MKYLILSLCIILCFVFPVFAVDGDEIDVVSDATWDLNQDIESLYEAGLVSDDVMSDAKEGILIDGAIPSETASYSGNSSLDSSISDSIVAESKEVDSLDNSSEITLKSLSPVPSSGNAYSDPTLISVEYAEDAAQGSLLEVIYGLLGKPVKAYHYRWQSSSQGYNVYSVQVVDYDVPWIASCLMLMLVLFCIFKAGGALLSKL